MSDKHFELFLFFKNKNVILICMLAHSSCHVIVVYVSMNGYTWDFKKWSQSYSFIIFHNTSLHYYYIYQKLIG